MEIVIEMPNLSPLKISKSQILKIEEDFPQDEIYRILTNINKKGSYSLEPQ